MIDHVLGRPSLKFRKIQVFAVVFFWSSYLFRGNRHGPPFLRSLSSRLSRHLTPWQTVVTTMLWLYVARNFSKIFGLESPEPLANLYTRSYFRATWITTALDAGFWTAMRIRNKWLRDLSSFVFSLYYLIAAEKADEKVRKVRATLTVDHLRVSWNKSTTPYLKFFTSILRPRLARYPPRRIRIPRPRNSSYRDHSDMVHGWLYFDGPLHSLRKHTKVVLDIPGGGFVAMSPRNNDDRLLAWAGKTGLPILSLDYSKAPEYPYPYALNECYDVYRTLVASRGRCIGLTGAVSPRIVVCGDSAGGNLASGLVLMILQSGGTDTRRRLGEPSLPPPDGLILVYPGLDMNIGNWMTDEQMSLIKDSRMRETNKNVIHRKSEDYYKLDPSTPHPSDDEDDDSPSSHPIIVDPPDSPTLSMRPSPSAAHINRSQNIASQTIASTSSKPHKLKTRLAMSSMLSYFNDRILTPEMMRAMIILYVGPHNRPDFSTDFLLSPLLAPEALLARFPKTYFLTGERDPLVDDTVVFAGRIRQAKFNHFRERQELGLEKPRAVFCEKDHVEVVLIPGISHGFLQFVSVFPEGWRHIFRCARWIEEIFVSVAARADEGGPLQKREIGSSRLAPPTAVRHTPMTTAPMNGNTFTLRSPPAPRHHRRTATSSSAEEDKPLEMSVIRPSNANLSSKKPHLHQPSSPPTNSSATPTQTDISSGKRSVARRTTESDGSSRRSNKNHARSGVGDERGRGREPPHPPSSPCLSPNPGPDPGQKDLKRPKSLVSLASSDDLLGRRMTVFAAGLTGRSEELRTP